MCDSTASGAVLGMPEIGAMEGKSSTWRHSLTPVTQQHILLKYRRGMVWYGILVFNVPLDTVQVISETTTPSSDVHLPFSNGGPAT